MAVSWTYFDFRGSTDTPGTGGDCVHWLIFVGSPRIAQLRTAKRVVPFWVPVIDRARVP